MEPIPDMGAQADRFKQAVREAVEAPGFDTAEFVTRLCARRVANDRDWLRRCDEGHKLKEPIKTRYERIADRLVKKLEAAGADERAQQDAKDRIMRAICASGDLEQKAWDKATAGAETMTMASFMAYAVFIALDRAFLAAPEALLFEIDHAKHAHEPLAALARIGPPAGAFAPLLIERLDHIVNNRDGGKYGFAGAAALGSVGRDNPAVVDAMIQRLRSPHEAIRAAAADTLAHMGTNVAGREGEILSLLHEMFDRGGIGWFMSVRAVASVGRHDRESRRRVIDLARPRPPRIVRPEFPHGEYDEVMHERGVAIDAIGAFLTDHPDECVPVLIEGISSFDEYDPDECYSGPHGRIAGAIERFGPRAGTEAAIALAQHLVADEHDYPKAICFALAAIGPQAAGALPLLEELCRKTEGGQPDPEELVDDPEPDKHSYYAAWAIWRIKRSMSDSSAGQSS
jgi:HEAT repeat protein